MQASKHDLKQLLAGAQGNTPVLRRGRGMTLSTEQLDAAKSDIKPTGAVSQPVKRVKRGYTLREDLIKACKRLAFEHDRTLYSVMEEALEAYLRAVE